jgi:hypothetical protein
VLAHATETQAVRQALMTFPASIGEALPAPLCRHKLGEWSEWQRARILVSPAG